MTQPFLVRFADRLHAALGYQFPPLGGHAMDALFGILPRHAEMTLLPQIRVPMDFKDLTMRATYWQGGRFEQPTPQILSEWGTHGTTFFDIGSNYGFFSYWMLSQHPQLAVHSFEPNPKTFALVDRIRTSNHLDRMRAHHLGMADQEAFLDLHPGVDDSGHSTFGDHPDLRGEPVARVRVQAFDAWLGEAGLPLPRKPEWVAKIDVEGFELKVLQGMRGALRARAFLGLAVEINEFTLALAGAKPEELYAELESDGYVSLATLPEGRHWPLDKTANAFFVPRDSYAGT